MRIHTFVTLFVSGCGLVQLNGKPVTSPSPSGPQQGQPVAGAPAAGAPAPSGAMCPDGKRYSFQLGETIDGHRANDVAIVDINGDGRSDLVIGSDEPPSDHFISSIGTMLGNADGTFAPMKLNSFGDHDWQLSMASVVAVGDLDGDGKLDVVGAEHGNSGKPSYVLGNGDGTFQPIVVIGKGMEAEGGGDIALADLNGDKRLDVIVPPLVYINAGKGKFMSQQKLDPKNYPRNGVAVADFDGDGTPDVAAADASTIYVYFGSGTGGFRDSIHIDVDGGNGYLATADFNGDGKPDLATAGQVPFVVLNQGGGKFAPPARLPLDAIGGADRINTVIAADLNQDGKPDLAGVTWASYGQGENVVVYMNTGGGRFAKPLLVPSGRPDRVSAGFIAGDKVMSLVAVERRAQHNSQASLYVLRGTCR